MSSAPPSLPPIVVIGAGIIGITTAIRILETCHAPVQIIAEHLPSDPPTARYASLMAGAHHLSFADDDDTRQRSWDRRTFNIMMAELQSDGDKSGLLQIKQTEYYIGETRHLRIYEEHPDFCVNEYAPPIDHSVSFTSLTMTPSIYLARLVSRFEALGGGLHRRHLNSLADLVVLRPIAIVVCTGIGSLTLGGVEDRDVYPVRGQIVKVNAPWIKEGFTRQVGTLGGGEGGERTYVIPRVNGEVILGGTRDVSWEESPQEETGKDIMRRAAEICPNLALDGVQVSHLVGFRPARTGGVRLERGSFQGIPVVYNYGHGGAGWQSCWGCAEDAATLVTTP